MIIGGFGSDDIRGGQGNDIIFGDTGIVQYAQPAASNEPLATCAARSSASAAAAT